MNTVLQVMATEVFDSTKKTMPVCGQQNINSDVTNNFFGVNPHSNLLDRDRTFYDYPWLPESTRYNLIVVDGEITTHEISVKKVCVESEVRDNYPNLTPADVEEITSLPALLVSKNKESKRASADCFALFAKIKRIETLTDDIKFTFEALFRVSQQRLNSYAASFALGCKDYSNELDRPHWTVKNINLVEALNSTRL